MCKATIEKTVNEIIGVKKSNWDVEKKKIDISFNDSKINLKEIHNAIATLEYDTEKVKGDDVAYIKLPRCYQYEREMEMKKKQKKKILIVLY